MQARTTRNKLIQTLSSKNRHNSTCYRSDNTNPNSRALQNSSKLACKTDYSKNTTIPSLYIHIRFCSIQTTTIHKNTDMQPKPFQETTLKTLLDTIQARNWNNIEFSGRRSIAGDWPESSDTTLFVRFLCRILFYTFPVVYPSNLSFE